MTSKPIHVVVTLSPEFIEHLRYRVRVGCCVHPLRVRSADPVHGLAAIVLEAALPQAPGSKLYADSVQSWQDRVQAVCREPAG